MSKRIFDTQNEFITFIKENNNSSSLRKGLEKCKDIELFTWIGIIIDPDNGLFLKPLTSVNIDAINTIIVILISRHNKNIIQIMIDKNINIKINKIIITLSYMFNNIYFIPIIDKYVDCNLCFDNLDLWDIYNVEFLCKILNGIKNININKLNIIGQSFMYTLIDRLLKNNKTLYNVEQLIELLLFNYYDFDIIDDSGNTLLDHMLFNNIDINIICKFIKIDEYNITNNCKWFWILLHTKDTYTKNLGRIFYSILDRKDHKTFLLNLIHNYRFPTAEDDIILIMELYRIKDKLSEMVVKIGSADISNCNYNKLDLYKKRL